MTVDARVAVLYPKENELKIEEIAFPSPEPDQVIVKQFASGVCHSQLHQIHAPREKPVILGHESTGLVIDVGKKVSHVAPGDTVLVTWVPRDAARAERPAVAARLDIRGQAAISQNVFTWADHTIADEQYVVKVDSDIATDVTSIIDTEGEGVVFLYLVLFYGFLFSILLTGVLEGFMFTYAILKNEILGIDEQLRRTFSAALFATLGGIALLTTSEVIEGFVPGGGLAAGLVVGAPLVVLRKPIFNAIQNFSSVLMPEAFTAAEKSYLEAYEIAMEDRIITPEERKFLSLQAKTLGLNESQVEDLESWYDQQISDEEE